MNASSISRLPAYAGSSALSGLGGLARWSWQRYAAAPLQNAALGLLGLAIVMSATNALFWQSGVHPAPLFSEQTEAVISPHVDNSVPVVPMPRVLRQQPLSEPTPEPVVQPLQQVAPVPGQNELPHLQGSVSNAQLAQAQEILKALGLFDGKVDGFYGPRTAEGLRAFELRNGLAPRGALTPEIIQKILASPATSQPSAQTVIVQTPPAPELAPSVEVRAQTRSVVVAEVSQSAPMPPVLAQNQASPDPLSAITQSVAARQNISFASQPAPAEPVVDAELIRKIQRGLASLGFLAGSIDGVAGEETARAIRNFEVYNNYQVTGEVSADMLELLLQGGAAI